MSMNPQLDMKIKQYESTVVDFITKESGHFIMASHDNAFGSILRSTLNKQLALDTECLTTIMDEDTILKQVKDQAMRKKTVVMFIERVFHEKETSFLIKQLKAAFDNLKIIILTHEAEQQRLVLLHEIGADNFISKPISINSLIEKIAFTVKPQSKLGKLIEQGKLLITQGAYENSLKLARAILEMKPNSASAFLILGDAYKGLGKRGKALEAYEQACESSPMYMDPLKKLASFHREEGNLEVYLNYLEKLDKLSPLNVERKVDMGGVHVELGNGERAEVLFQGAVKQARKEAMSLIESISTRIANIYTKNDPAMAEKYYRQALDAKGKHLDKNDIRTFNLLGIALRKQGKWQEAILEYENALRISPNDENLFYNLAMAHSEGKDIEKAYSFVKQALNLNPEFFKQNPILCYNGGLISSRAGAVKDAKMFLKYAILLKPDYQAAKSLLASLQ